MPVEPTRSTSDVRSRVAFGRAGVGFCASAGVKRLETIAAARRAGMTVRADDFTLKTSVGFLDVLPGVDVSMPQKRRQKARGKNIKTATRAGYVFTFALCLLPLAFCLLSPLRP